MSVLKETVIVLRIVASLWLICSRANGQSLNNNPYGLALGNEEAVNKSVGNEDLLNVLEDSHGDEAARAEKALKTDLVDLKYDVSAVCLNHTKLFLGGLVLGQLWALRMIDAMGKPHSGLLNGHFTWLGSYDECIAIQANVTMAGKTISPYTGRYCSASFPIGQIPQVRSLLPSGDVSLKIGICVPNSCSEKDTKALLNILLSLLPVNTSSLPEPTVTCQTESREYDVRAIVALTICSLFGLVMVIATAYDVIVLHWLSKRTKVLPNKEKIKGVSYVSGENEQVQLQTYDLGKKEYGVSNGNVPKFTQLNLDGPKVQVNGVTEETSIKTQQVTTFEEESYEPGTLGKVLLSFSIYTNASKILNTDQPAGTLSAINGIRFISMTWVILGHNFGFHLQSAENVSTYGLSLLKRFTFEAIKNALVSVDTFFTLSGLLVAYLSLKEMKKRGGALKFQWGMFYFHRFWRLTPPYMLFMMFYVCLFAYWYNGPLWPKPGNDGDPCVNYWWRNLLYINNFFPYRKMCMAWGWYLANDMQFYILSPLMLVPLYYSKILGVISCVALLLVNFISVGIISSNNHFSTNVVFDRTGKVFDDYYDKPWCRIGPYVAGFFAGYILYKTDCKLRIPKIANVVGWLIATAMALVVLYGTHDSSGYPSLSTGAAAAYNATHRTAWGIAVAWVVVACATGHGGFVNTLLSWKALIPLSRLTYCAYLVHPVIMFVYNQGRRTLMYFTDIEAVYLFLGNLCLAYAVAFIVSLTFESPMMGLEKALLRRKKKS